MSSSKIQHMMTIPLILSFFCLYHIDHCDALMPAEMNLIQTQVPVAHCSTVMSGLKKHHCAEAVWGGE